jgi:ATP-binding cassette subfamily C (CFTR/MRP) protein 1
MASVLRHIKAIKLSAYETPITNTALTLRDNEIHCLREWIKEILKVSIFTNYNSNFLSLITVTTYTLVSLFGGGGVSTAKIFTTVTTIALISEPLLMLGQQLGNIVSAWASWKRVEEFLLSEEKVTEVQGSSSGIELLDKKSAMGISFSEADIGVKGKDAFLHGISVVLTAPPLWMIVGRVGSVSSSVNRWASLTSRVNRYCCKHSWGSSTFFREPPDVSSAQSVTAPRTPGY